MTFQRPANLIPLRATMAGMGNLPTAVAHDLMIDGIIWNGDEAVKPKREKLPTTGPIQGVIAKTMTNLRLGGSDGG